MNRRFWFWFAVSVIASAFLFYLWEWLKDEASRVRPLSEHWYADPEGLFVGRVSAEQARRLGLI